MRPGGRSWSSPRILRYRRRCGRDGTPDAPVIRSPRAGAAAQERDAGHDERPADARGQDSATPPVGGRCLPLVDQDPRKGMARVCHGPATTLNEELVAPARPVAAAFKVQPVHSPVTCRLLNVATPLTALTVVGPVKPPATTGPASVRVITSE